MKKFLVTLFNLLSAAIIVISIFILFTVVMTRQGDAPNIFGYSMFRVMTGSMEPTIPTDSLIVVRHAEPAEVRQGDVISYYSSDPELGGAINTHRVVSVECDEGKYQFTMKGDANTVDDQYPAMGDSLIGKVIFTSYPLGVAVNFISKPFSFVLLIILPLFLMICVNLVRMFSSAGKIMKAEEEAAVREAVEAIRERKRKERQEAEAQEYQKAEEDAPH